ncbi:septal ring lytic transglycosylase RlpA family protein [Candidatus Contendibacter odensensis]|uniref:Endolytic peptidoglycan transglycosylase RlpA n=1 Tax=Candidatus Contendobacter odensis Run_B_J11 TaxID=1400861 RepID=A0A7U7GBC4_9GAMM|nr:septal ring lytic transglycosylase RlpA family protein [Candidatus Contendobacter odensis]CDH45018.1 hypothetical protein BN874_200088 [Candidatus Contendobacter odensis Run_B_J11]
MAKSSWSHALVWVSLAGALAGCSTVPDHPQSANPLPVSSSDTATSSDEPIPKVESPSRSGNPDTYVVFGRRYRVKETSEGYREEGIASWYGWEFHGRKTSSGPLFNMFELTAAHKSLPLPTYVQVTNLENGRHIVVKVTDRGPFVGERAIDLSYAAADRLGMLEQGTARVEIAALAPYQSLPLLAARRAEQRELLASRQDRPEPIIKPAAIQFARAMPARPTAQAPGKPPAQVLARVEREKAKKLLAQAQAQAKTSTRLALANGERGKAKPQTQPPVRLALANVEHNPPKSAAKTAGAKPLAKAEIDRNPVRPALRLASAAPASKGRNIVEERQTPTATGNQKGKPEPARNIAGRSDAHQPKRNDGAVNAGQRITRVETSASNRPEPRNANESRQATLRLASSRINRPRIIAD